MISFQTLKIRDFKSIKSAEVEYTAGVWQVVGINNDATFKSNGSGKTTLLEAIQQCLFNKTTSPTPIEDTSRKVIGVTSHSRGYRLELTFIKGDDSYTVINDRQTMRIVVMKNGKDLALKSIPIALKYISNVVGMDFQTFVTLTFINHNTIVELLDNFSSSNLMKIILNFSQITSFEKRAKDEQKIINNSLVALSGQIQTINDSLSILNKFEEIDLVPIRKAKVLALQDIEKLDETLLKETVEAEEKHQILHNKVESAKLVMGKLLKKITTSHCESCGTLLEMTEEQVTIHEAEYSVMDDALDIEIDKRDDLYETAYNLRASFRYKSRDLAQNLNEIEQQLIVATTKNQLFNDSKAQADELRTNLQKLTFEHDEATFKLQVIQTTVLVIKSGDIQKDLLHSFVAALNLHLSRFITFVSLDYINIMAEATKTSVSFSITDTRFNHNISIHTLSGGHKTRLRLVILLAMLYTIKDLADVSTNLLVFDESLDTLDSSATQDLANLFDYLVNNDSKFIALISHGAQLADIDFSGKITATKTDGITTVTKEVT